MTRRREKKQQLVEGTIVRIPYADAKHRYAQLLAEPFVRVFDTPPDQNLDDLGQIVGYPELFRLAVFTFGITDGRWPVVGHLPLRAEERWIPDQFVQDRFRPENLRIISTTREGHQHERPATVAECEGLEAVSVWDPVHVEERLVDLDAGRPNLSLLAARLIHPGEVFTILLDHGRDASGRWIVSGGAHAEIRSQDRVSLGSDGRLAFTVEVVADDVDGPPVPFLRSGDMGVLHLAGDVTPEENPARILRRVETDSDSN